MRDPQITPAAAAIYVLMQLAWPPLVIGGTLGFLVMCFGSMTGVSFNPARAFGPALVANEFGGAGTWLLAYVLAPIAGALAAAFGYNAIVIQARPSLRPVDTLGGP